MSTNYDRHHLFQLSVANIGQFSPIETLLCYFLQRGYVLSDLIGNRGPVVPHNVILLACINQSCVRFIAHLYTDRHSPVVQR